MPRIDILNFCVTKKNDKTTLKKRELSMTNYKKNEHIYNYFASYVFVYIHKEKI